MTTTRKNLVTATLVWALAVGLTVLAAVIIGQHVTDDLHAFTLAFAVGFLLGGAALAITE